MPSFRPTRTPPGRLARLGVVLDKRNAPARVGEVAKMCERAGVDALWVRDRLPPGDELPRLEAWTCLTLAGLDTSRARVGGMLDTALRPPATLAAMAATLDLALGGRLEIGLGGSAIEDYARAFRGLLGGGGPRLSVEATDPAEIGVAIRVADDLIIPAEARRDMRAMLDLVGTACEDAGRDPSSLGIAVELPVSIGRTSAEAQARASAESMFRATGHPSQAGIFGTLEQCQDRVIELAHAGVTDLRCILPNTRDVPDVIAQLTAAVVGTLDVLRPTSPRSRAPDPPEGWGGRPSRP